MKTSEAAAVIALLVISGCTSTPEATGYMGNQRKGLEEIQVLTGAPDRPFDALGPVSGVLCNRNGLAMSADAVLKEAKELRIEANKLGADAVIDVTCQKTGGTSILSNCWATYRCSGQAVRFK